MSAPTNACPRCASATTTTPDGLGRVCPRCNIRFVPAVTKPAVPAQKISLPNPAAPADQPHAEPWMKVALAVGGALAAFLAVVLVVVVAVAFRPRPAAQPMPVAAAPPADTPPPPATAPTPAEKPPTPAKAPPPKAVEKPAPPVAPPLPPPAPPELKPPPEDKPAPPELKPDDPVDKAVARAVAYLKKQIDADFPGDAYAGGNRTGVTALAGLALLESGVPADDPAVVKAAKAVRVATTTNTYEMALCVWFLDRLADPKDEDLIRSLAKRLAAGQTARGLWDYECVKNAPRGDLSLTQFAVLALWVARKHKVAVDAPLQRIAARCRSLQAKEGSWSYLLDDSNYMRDSMTCAGLMVLAVGRGVGPGGDKGAKAAASDPAVDKALRFLNDVFSRAIPAGDETPGLNRFLRPRGPVDGTWDDIYFLWSMERMAVVYDFKTIAGHDWYKWGADLLVGYQNDDGSWSNAYSGTVDTGFALLFLKRSNVAQDLTDRMLQLGPIKDVILDKVTAPEAGEAPPK